MRPYDARTTEQADRLKDDGAETDNFWILVSEGKVYLYEQRTGGPPKQRIEIPRRDFNKFVRWYLRDQKTK